LANSVDILQVMYDAFGVRLHAGKQAEVLPPFYVIWPLTRKIIYEGQKVVTQ
jgi:acid phosphatase family membrane protein YuiD